MSANRTAVVTGAARGIGAATVGLLAEAGMNVLACDIDAIELKALLGRLGSERVAMLPLDVGAPDAPGQVQDALSARWGTASVLVNNAGIAPKYSGVALNILDMTPEEWERILHINLTSAMRLCQALLPAMKENGWGRVVNVSSSGGRTRALGPVGPAYMASKAGMLGLTRHIAAELGPYGITANVVAPGRIATALGATTGQTVAEDYARRVPVGRIGAPAEVAAAIAFLASEGASFVNGAVIDVNGGMFML
ncbi:3-oxoacyl-[acyl-carrier-protein] reductase FabG [compost metagenome]